VSGRPGGVYLDLPAKLFSQVMDAEAGAKSLVKVIDPAPAQIPAPSAVKRALDVLKSAKRPLIILGKGAAYAQADDAIRVLVEKSGIPFLPMSMAKGLLPEVEYCHDAYQAAQDSDAAQLMGIDINRTISATFFIGAVLAGAGGIIYGLYYNNLSFDLGFENGLIAFTAAVFGGIGNIQGAALGGLGIGLIRAMNDGYFSTAWTDVVLFGILIGVLVFRPTGLLGARVPEK